jgi:hypothetical protein
VCSFLKSCVQFLVKCVLSGEAKGRHAYKTLISHLSKGRHAYRMCVSHLSKGRCALWRRVSLLLNMYKKRKPYRLFSTGMLLAPERRVPVGTDTPNVFVPMVTQWPGARSTTWSTTCLKSLKQMAYRGFKS